MDETRGWNGLLPFSKALYESTYFLPNEDYSGWLDRVTGAYANDRDHKERMKKYIWNYWGHPSTPISSNAGTTRGLPISCFVKSIDDSRESIFDGYSESFWLASQGGGIGTCWSKVREVNSSVGPYGGTSSGIIPFLGITDRSTLAISQGNLRRGSEAAYLHISHPEIEEFIDIRKPTGDANRRSQNIHHAVVIPDTFMIALENREPWNLVSPHTGDIVKTVDAFDLWCKLLEVRATLKGEPYLLFIDTVNDMAPEEYKLDGVKVETSQLCNEIVLETSSTKTAVCCLASMNLEYYDEYINEIDQVVADWSDFLDNVLTDFINRTEGMPGFTKARFAAQDERSIGLGVMGFHSYLQSKGIPWESSLAAGTNSKIFKQIKESADKHNDYPYDDVCPMAQRTGTTKRNIHITAVAPTMSISNLCNVTSSGIEPIVANSFVQKVNTGSFTVTNKYLKAKLKEYGKDTVEVWDSIKRNEGSVQHLEFLSDWDKDVFKTAYEIDQRWVIDLAGDRQNYIDQSQSLNLFIPANSHVSYIYDVHVRAWKKKVKGLYYLRSTASNRGSAGSTERKAIGSDECLSCQ